MKEYTKPTVEYVEFTVEPVMGIVDGSTGVSTSENVSRG